MALSISGTIVASDGSGIYLDVSTSFGGAIANSGSITSRYGGIEVL